MGTDFLTAVFSDDELRKKYKNYRVPAAKIRVGSAGEDLAATCHAQIENIRISMNLKDAASASFTVTNIYNSENRSINGEIKDTLCLGNILKVELGYESELETLFCGFIYETTIQFAEMPSMHITAVDVRRLMYDNCRKNYEWPETTHSDVFKKIMNHYEKLGLNLTVDDTTAELTSPLLQNGNDLKMILQLCKAANRKFIVCGSKAYFVKKSEAGSITTLKPGYSLLSFSQRYSYSDTKIKVHGNLKQHTEPSTETRTYKSAGKSVLSNSTTKVITLPDISSTAELAARADEEKEALKEQKQSGSGSCIGIPVLVPGRYVKIDGLDAGINGEYYLQSVDHSFGSDGYTTNFTLGGKK